MNRRDRRAAVAGRKNAPIPIDIVELLGEANRAYQEGHPARVEAICRKILARAPAHVAALNLLGLVNQASGHHRIAVKMFAKAIAANDVDAACHYNIASSLQLLGQRKAAAAHFNQALALGLSGKLVEDFVMQNEAVAKCVQRTMDTAIPAISVDPFTDREIATIANDVFLQCALQSILLRGITLEFFLTHLRLILLRRATNDSRDPAEIPADVVALFCALAQQCFINEYVYSHTDDEKQQASQLRELLLQKLSSGSPISPLLLAAVAAYFPLHSLPGAEALLALAQAEYTGDLLRQQIREPLAEAQDRRAIPVLTAIDDHTSTQVMHQYEENPFPRWTIHPLAALTGKTVRHAVCSSGDAQCPELDILIAGCGTGKHAFDTAERWHDARILAIDISLPSLAYARRKAREAALPKIEYAQADILNLRGIGRSFDHIEAVGVLHHLANPSAGWRILLSLLKPNGILRVGLYSEAARREIVEARAIIAEEGFLATPDGIRALRQALIRRRHQPRWARLLATAEDFYSMSGCRDLFFNVMEHRFTIPEISALLNEHGLSFLGFDLASETIEKFQRRHTEPEALTNLDYWDAFETANPQTFRNMYVFSVSKKGRAPH